MKVWDTAALLTEVGQVTGPAPKGGKVERVLPLLHSLTVATEAGQAAKFQVCRFVGEPRLPLQPPTGNAVDGEVEAKDSSAPSGLRQRKPAASGAAAPVSSGAAAATAALPAPAAPEQLLAIVNLASRTKPGTRLVSTLISRPAQPASTTPPATPSPPTFTPLWSVPAGSAALVQMAVYPSEPTATIAVASNDGAIHLYAAASDPARPPVLLMTADRAHDLPATGLAFSADGGYLCSASADRTFRFYEVGPWRRKGGKGMSTGEMLALMGLMLLAVAVLVGVAMWVFVIDDADRAGVEDLLRLWLTGSRSSLPQQQMRRRG